MINKGDTVRFLNAVGGGVVVRIDSAKKVLFVEDSDGFEIPMLERECVVVGAVNKDTNFPVKNFNSKPTDSFSDQKLPSNLKSTSPSKEDIAPSTKSYVLSEITVVETPEGEVLKAFLAFFPMDIKQLQTTNYECYLVNDSNYFLYYNIVNGENDQLQSVASGMIEPNMQELITEVTKEDLNSWENIRVQLLPFKYGKTYIPQAVIDESIKINSVKFYKLHSFTDNDYFDEPVMIVDIISEKEIKAEKNILVAISPEEIKNAMSQKDKVERPRIVKRQASSEIIEIDLHINELLDSTSGLSNADMLQHQLAKFHEILQESKNRKGQKIVFIHGKGEGVLRKEIEKLLKTQYKQYYFQDASFREYGFGATLVTIK